MSDSFEVQNDCDHADSIKNGKKFCGGCGMNIKALVEQYQAREAVVADPKMAEQFRAFVREALLDGNEVSDVLDALLDGASDMGISSEDAVVLIEQIKAEQEAASILDLKLAYDVSAARAGVANGTTPLSFRIENTSKKNIQKLSISVYHPETKHRIHFKPVTGLLRGMTKTIGMEIQLALVGFHTIREGVLTVQSLTGAIEEYAIASEIRIYADNSEAARANISTQTFTTNMGGVLSADGALAGGVANVQHSPLWEVVKLVRIAGQQEDSDEGKASIAESPIATTQVVPEPPFQTASPADFQVQEGEVSVAAKAELPSASDTFKPKQEETAELLKVLGARQEQKANELTAELMAFQSIELSTQKEQEPSSVCDHEDSIKNQKKFCAICGVNVQSLLEQKQTVDSLQIQAIAEVKIESKRETMDLGPAFRILQPEDFANAHKTKTVFEELLADFVRLLQLLAQADPRHLDVVWLRKQIDFFTLRRLSDQLNIEPHEILAVNPSVSENASVIDRLAENAAVVVGIRGFYLLLGAERVSEQEWFPCMTWQLVHENQFKFQIEYLAEESEYCEVRLRTNDVELFVFEIADSLDVAVLEELVSRANARLTQIISTDEIIRDFEHESLMSMVSGGISPEKHPAPEAVSLSTQQMVQQIDEVDTSEHAVPTGPFVEVDLASVDVIKKFFVQYALLCGLHNHAFVKTVHIFDRHQVNFSEVATALADRLLALLDYLDPVVIMVDRDDQYFDACGKLSGWSGLASVLTQTGIHHIVSTNEGGYDFVDNDSRLSWGSFFSLSGNIQYRNDTPDIWLGTPSNILLKGSYFDFSNNIDGWIRYVDEHKTELKTYFKEFSNWMQAWGQK